MARSSAYTFSVTAEWLMALTLQPQDSDDPRADLAANGRGRWGDRVWIRPALTDARASRSGNSSGQKKRATLNGTRG